MPRQAVGLGAPQMIIWRPLPRRYTLVQAGVLVGTNEPPPPPPPPHPWRTFLYRLHVGNFHISILACVFDKVFNNFSLRSTRTFRFFHFSKLFFYDFFFSFTMAIKQSADRELRGEPAAFGDKPAPSMCKYSRRELWPRNWFLLGRVDDVRHVDRFKWISTPAWSHQLTSDLRDVYFFGYACNGRVWKQFRCLRLSYGACGAPPRLAALVRIDHVHLLIGLRLIIPT